MYQHVEAAIPMTTLDEREAHKSRWSAWFQEGIEHFNQYDQNAASVLAHCRDVVLDSFDQGPQGYATQLKALKDIDNQLTRREPVAWGRFSTEISMLSKYSGRSCAGVFTGTNGLATHTLSHSLPLAMQENPSVSFDTLKSQRKRCTMLINNGLALMTLLGFAGMMYAAVNVGGLGEESISTAAQAKIYGSFSAGFVALVLGLALAFKEYAGVPLSSYGNNSSWKKAEAKLNPDESQALVKRSSNTK